MASQNNYREYDGNYHYRVNSFKNNRFGNDNYNERSNRYDNCSNLGQSSSHVTDYINSGYDRNYTSSNIHSYKQNDQSGSWGHNDFNQHQRGLTREIPVSDDTIQGHRGEGDASAVNRFNYRNQQFIDKSISERNERQTGENYKRFREIESDFKPNKQIKYSSFDDNDGQMHDGQSFNRFETRREVNNSFSHESRREFQGKPEIDRFNVQSTRSFSRVNMNEREKQIPDIPKGNLEEGYRFPEREGLQNNFEQNQGRCSTNSDRSMFNRRNISDVFDMSNTSNNYQNIKAPNTNCMQNIQDRYSSTSDGEGMFYRRDVVDKFDSQSVARHQRNEAPPNKSKQEHQNTFSSHSDSRFPEQNISTQFDTKYSNPNYQIKGGGAEAEQFSSYRKSNFNEQFTGQREFPAGQHHQEVKEEQGYIGGSSDLQRSLQFDAANTTKPTFENFEMNRERNDEQLDEPNEFSPVWQPPAQRFSSAFDRIPPLKYNYQFNQNKMSGGNQKPFNRPFQKNIRGGRNIYTNRFKKSNCNANDEPSDSLDHSEINDDNRETEENHEDKSKSEDEGSMPYKSSDFILDHATKEKYKYHPPTARELSEILKDFVVMYFYKPRAAEEKNPFVVICESFRRSEKFGNISVEDGYLLGDKLIKFCTLRYSGMMLVRAVGQFGNQKEPRVRAGIELINKFAQYCYTLKMKASYFDAKYFDQKLQNNTSEYYRIVPASEVNNFETFTKYLANYEKEDSDQELIFELNNHGHLKAYLRSKGYNYRIPNPKSSHIIVSKCRSPQYLRDKMLAKGIVENEMYQLIPPQGEGVDLVKFSSITEFVPALKSRKKSKKKKRYEFVQDFDEDMPLPFPLEELYGKEGIETEIMKAAVPWDRIDGNKRRYKNKGKKKNNKGKKKK